MGLRIQRPSVRWHHRSSCHLLHARRRFRTGDHGCPCGTPTPPWVVLPCERASEAPSSAIHRRHTPDFHHWHHASEEEDAIWTNYGSFLPIWDLMFGTYYVPVDRMPVTYGVDEEIPGSMLGQLRYPFEGMSSPWWIVRHPMRSLRSAMTYLRRLLGELRFSIRRPKGSRSGPDRSTAGLGLSAKAGTRTRVPALATPGDNHYTTFAVSLGDSFAYEMVSGGEERPAPGSQASPKPPKPPSPSRPRSVMNTSPPTTSRTRRRPIGTSEPSNVLEASSTVEVDGGCTYTTKVDERPISPARSEAMISTECPEVGRLAPTVLGWSRPHLLRCDHLGFHHHASEGIPSVVLVEQGHSA